ncbi:16S rRNA (guanine(527)-N(7))-methyltransferase RsmG [Lamprocystis purpurea]|uniref:16S rRNA (guanine(527)-N(7))-methyltransferase RsmG n=1 Tax=Lamprocystis purpurea TaxID=61598 RepID=UPI000362FAE4|nr:16S rRNA (guanine(527)-N(7))-methyltransferase RsmG [Lamprocystis purpurea]
MTRNAVFPDLTTDPNMVPTLPVSPRARLADGAAALGILLTPSQIYRMFAFLELLARWNRTYNLTAVRDPDEQVPRHLLDSLAIRAFLFGDTVLDLGTGAGLPGLPLALCDPDRRYCLLDGSGKKIRFVRQAVMEFGLTQVEAVHSRIESYRPGRKFSTIVTRAVAEIAAIHLLAAPLLDRPGRLLVMKGRYPHDELRNPALSDLDLTVHPLCVPFLEGDRHLIEIRCE